MIYTYKVSLFAILIGVSVSGHGQSKNLHLPSKATGSKPVIILSPEQIRTMSQKAKVGGKYDICVRRITSEGVVVQQVPKEKYVFIDTVAFTIRRDGSIK